MSRAGALALAFALAALGCQDKGERAAPDQTAARDRQGAGAAPGDEFERRDVTALVGDALRAAIGDLDGDGQSEIVLVAAGWVRVVAPAGTELARMPAPGGIQVLSVDDLDGDGRGEILAGWGKTVPRRDGMTRVSVIRLEGRALREEVVAAPGTERHDVVAILPLRRGPEPELFIAYFESKYMVRSARAVRRQGAWTSEPVALLRTATSYAWGDVDGDGEPDLVVGRVYGDERGADGDAFLLRPDGSRVAIPTTRGVRGLALADTDRDGTAEIFLGDGWHQDYGRRARGLLSIATPTGSAFETQILDPGETQYTLWSIHPVDLDGDGRPDLVTRGSSAVTLHRKMPAGWRTTRLAGETRDLAIGDLDPCPGPELLLLSPGPHLLKKRVCRQGQAPPPNRTE